MLALAGLVPVPKLKESIMNLSAELLPVTFTLISDVELLM
jgi:hypothetical protein